MNAVRVHAVVSGDGTLILEDLPFPPGTEVEVIVFAKPREHTQEHDSLRGSVLYYDDPMNPVAEDEWDALQ